MESEKKNLISTIESERNDKRVYAMSRLLKILCREDSFGLPRLGEPQEVEAITPSKSVGASSEDPENQRHRDFLRWQRWV